MSCRNLRIALAGLTLAAALTAAPPPAAAEDGGRIPAFNLAEEVWQWVVRVWMADDASPEETAGDGSTGEIGLQIDPNG